MDRNVEKILSYVNIVDEISEYVKLRKTGRGYSGLCPFHSEKTPSFHVNESKGLFYCFGCGKGGNVINFLKDIKGIPFNEVMLYLKNKYNIQIDNTRYYKDKNTIGEDPLKKVLRLTLNFYYENLFVYSSNSRHIVEYLSKRGISQNTAKEFKLGYSGFGNGLLNLLTRQGMDLKIAAEAGLLVKRQGDNRYFDRFTNKLIIPVFNINGEPVAFASREISPGFKGPKYVNTNNSSIFIKNETLFGLDKSLPYIKKENFAIVVEGYFDMITMYAAGIKNVVATMGTALSRNHIISLSRISDNIILLYDGDKAGINAINRGIELFQGFMENADKNIYAVTLDGENDPDSFIRKNGKDAMMRLISGNKKSPVEFIIDYHLSNILHEENTTGKVENPDVYGIINNKGGMEEVKKKILVIKEITPILKKINNNIILSYYLNLVSNRLKLKEELVRSYFGSISGGAVPAAGRGKEVETTAGGHSTATDSLGIEELIVKKIFSNFLLTEYVNDDIITEFSDKDTVFIIKEIKSFLGTLDPKDRKNVSNKGSQFIEDIIANTEFSEKWRHVYYSSSLADTRNTSDALPVGYEGDPKADIKKLLVRLKIKNINEACLKITDELRRNKLDESEKPARLRELAELKLLLRDYVKRIRDF